MPSLSAVKEIPYLPRPSLPSLIRPCSRPANDIDYVMSDWLAWNNVCVIGWPIVSPDRSVSNDGVISVIEWHERIGARLAEIGLCYLVERCHDFGSCCEKGSFAVYRDT